MVSMIGRQLVDSLQQEVIRLRALLEASQREVHENIREKAEFLRDPLVGPILKFRREVEGRKAHEADLLAALSEVREEMSIGERTYNGLLDEAEAELADLKSK